MAYTQAEIQELSIMFNGFTRYEDKLKFYDQQFNILPFTLPAFETNLFNFFSEENLRRFEAILREERNSGIATHRCFFFDKEQYIFSVRPVNSNYLVFNNYLINRFLQTGAYIKATIKQEADLIQESRSPLAIMLASAKEMVNLLERRVAMDPRRNALTQFATVFFKGLSDFRAWKAPAISSKRKKIIELYLYTLGFVYGEYMHALQFHHASQYANETPVDIQGKILLLKEFGFIDAIRSRYPFLNKTDLDRKIEDIIYLITGERMSVSFLRQ